jgi:aminoglycoside-2''-adenylyltransferase
MNVTLDQLVGFVGEQMRGFPAIWGVAGGWAIDLFLGRVSRKHADVEIALFRQDQGMLHRHFADWDFYKMVAGKKVKWEADEVLALPVHEIHGVSRKDSSVKMEFLLNEWADDQWVFRREPKMRMPIGVAIRATGCGVPVLCPSIVLLFKAKELREKDQEDFRVALPGLEEKERRWLREALEACYPGHAWLSELA